MKNIAVIGYDPNLKTQIRLSGLAKIKNALAKGKKLYDKRLSLKEKELKRDLERYTFPLLLI